jgi:predicted DNA-binding transcriptional regulator YafY
MGLLPANPRESLLPLELEEALELRRPVMMEYLDARNARTQRVIEPLHVRRSGGELLLIAHCQLRNDRRTFKLERIVQLTRLEVGAAPAPPGPAPLHESMPAPATPKDCSRPEEGEVVSVETITAPDLNSLPATRDTPG